MRENLETGDWLLGQYQRGAELARDDVIGAERIGNLTSFFKVVDGNCSLEQTGRRRFSLREVLQILQAPERQHVPDVARRRDKIASYLALLEGPQSNPVVTIVEFSDVSVVVDGNHTCMAAYLYASQHLGMAYVLPVYVMSVQGSVDQLD